MDYEALASEFLRALRDRQSQPSFSRWLGFRSNVAYAWESGRAFPTAARTFTALARKGLDLGQALHKFYGRTPIWLESADPASREGVAAFLDDLRGRRSIRALADDIGCSRYALARWLTGETAVRLPDFLRVLNAASHRLLDFIALLVDPHQLPSVADGFARLEAARRAAYDMPFSQAVLRALELSEYKSQAHNEGWIARCLGIAPQEEAECLRVLEQAGQVAWRNNRYEQTDSFVIDTRRDPERAWDARSYWTDVACARLSARAPGIYWYNVFGVSARDLERIRELQARHFRELRDLISQSEPVERVVLTVQHLVPLDQKE